MAGLIQQSEKPVGTLKELEEAGLSPGMFAACERPDGNAGIKGCPWFKNCRFAEYRDQVDGRKGPVNIGVHIINGSNKTFNGTQMPCFDFYFSGLAKRREQFAITKDVIKIVAYEGDGRKIKQKETYALHPTRDPLCQDCQKGNCKRRVAKVKETEVEPFPRPRESLSELVLAEDAIRAFSSDMDAEMDNGSADDVAPPPAVGKGGKRVVASA